MQIVFVLRNSVLSNLFVCVYTRGTSVDSLIRRTWVEFAHSLSPEKFFWGLGWAVGGCID